MSTAESILDSPPAVAGTALAGSHALSNVITLAGRQLRRTIRQPFALIPSLIIPIFFLVVNLGALSRCPTAGPDWRWSKTSSRATSTSCF